jgi:hypothetical protein
MGVQRDKITAIGRAAIVPIWYCGGATFTIYGTAIFGR